MQEAQSRMEFEARTRKQLAESRDTILTMMRPTLPEGVAEDDAFWTFLHDNNSLLFDAAKQIGELVPDDDVMRKIREAEKKAARRVVEQRLTASQRTWRGLRPGAVEPDGAYWTYLAANEPDLLDAAVEWALVEVPIAETARAEVDAMRTRVENAKLAWMRTVPDGQVDAVFWTVMFDVDRPVYNAASFLGEVVPDMATMDLVRLTEQAIAAAAAFRGPPPPPEDDEDRKQQELDEYGEQVLNLIRDCARDIRQGDVDAQEELDEMRNANRTFDGHFDRAMDPATDAVTTEAEIRAAETIADALREHLRLIQIQADTSARLRTAAEAV